MVFTGPYSSWYSTPSLPSPTSSPKELPMILMQQVVPVGNWHTFSQLGLLFQPLDFLLFLLVWLWSNGEPVAWCWLAMQLFSLQFKDFSLYLEEEMILAGNSGSILFWKKMHCFLGFILHVYVHKWHFTTKLSMLVFLFFFFLSLHHVHFKKDYMEKRLVLLTANRPLHFLSWIMLFVCSYSHGALRESILTVLWAFTLNTWAWTWVSR